MLRPLLLGLALAGTLSACASKASTPPPAGAGGPAVRQPAASACWNSVAIGLPK